MNNLGHVFIKHIGGGVCDECNGMISKSSSQQSTKCRSCKYLIHISCGRDSTYECPGLQDTIKPAFATIVRDNFRRLKNVYQISNKSELLMKITKFNTKSNDGALITMNSDGIGFSCIIRVELKLLRPIKFESDARDMTLKRGQRESKTNIFPALNTSALKSGSKFASVKRQGSFRLPNNTMVHVNISNEDSTKKVIEKILQKFRIETPGSKFCIFWNQQKKTKSTTMEKLEEDDMPLEIMLNREDVDHNCPLIMQENDSDDFSWELFSYPELNNFKKIIQNDADRVLTTRKKLFQEYKYALEMVVNQKSV